MTEKARPPLGRRLLARAGLGLALGAVAFLALRSMGATHEVRLVYVVGDRAASVTSLDVAFLAGERAARTKTWAFATGSPRAVEDVVALREGDWVVHLVWNGAEGRGEARHPLTVGAGGVGAPVVVPLEPASR